VSTMASLSGLVGGILIGLSAVWLMAALGRIAGVSGIVSGLLAGSAGGGSQGAFLLVTDWRHTRRI